MQIYKPFQDSVNCLDFHPNGEFLLASSTDSTSKLINVAEGRLAYTLRGHYKSIFNCTFNRDGSKFMTSGKDKRYLMNMIYFFFKSTGDVND